MIDGNGILQPEDVGSAIVRLCQMSEEEIQKSA